MTVPNSQIPMIPRTESQILRRPPAGLRYDQNISYTVGIHRTCVES